MDVLQGWQTQSESHVPCSAGCDRIRSCEGLGPIWANISQFRDQNALRIWRASASHDRASCAQALQETTQGLA